MEGKAGEEGAAEGGAKEGHQGEQQQQQQGQQSSAGGGAGGNKGAFADPDLQQQIRVALPLLLGAALAALLMSPSSDAMEVRAATLLSSHFSLRDGHHAACHGCASELCPQW